MYIMYDIPKIFYQSWDREIPEKIMDENEKYIQGFTYKRFSIEDIQNYLKKNWNDNVLKLFNSYKKTAHKIDLWRYCILYETGGVYMDADCVLKSDINPLLNNHAVFVTNNRDEKDIFNGFIMTFPKNKIIKEILDFMFRVKTSIEDDYYYNCKELYTIVNRYIDFRQRHDYITNKLGFYNAKICILIDKQLIDGRYYPFYNEIPILVETNELYPYT